jgi:hypothetical protein
MMRARRLLEALASLRLTVACLIVTMVLVLVGTVAQVSMGTFTAQQRFFNSVFVFADVGGSRVPVFPGGIAIGGLWLINLTAAFITRFRHYRGRPGLVVSHLGVILLLLGQCMSQLLARETQMPIEIGQTLNYSESPRRFELAIIMKSNPSFDEVTRIPNSLLVPGAVLAPSSLPFSIHVKEFFSNARLRMADATANVLATDGIGRRVAIEPAPLDLSDEAVNNPSAFVEFMEGERSLGTWLVSSGLGAPQFIHSQDKDFRLDMRPERRTFPFSLTLLDFKHDIYPGTDIPKNFSSRVRISNPVNGENRETLIYMNHPLRTEGKTFYQASFGKGDRVSVLQVVENPVWFTPYISCAMILFGLAIHFLTSLARFRRRA